MGEFVEIILVIFLGIPLIVVLLWFGFVVYLALGWILILFWLFMGMPTAEPMFGFVILSILVYVLAGFLLVLKPDVDGLPPALKFLAQFLPAPLRKTSSDQVDLPSLAEQMKSSLMTPFSNLEKKFQKRRYEQATEGLRVDTEYHDAQAELHRTAQEFNRAKLRAEEAERARQRNG